MAFFNPFKYFTPEQYTNFWQHLFSTILMGFWGRFFASAFLVMAFWFGVIRQKVVPALVFFCLTAVIAYFGSFGKAVFWWLF